MPFTENHELNTGHKNPNAKLHPRLVLQIRRDWDAEYNPDLNPKFARALIGRLAEEHHVSANAIRDVVINQSWKSVELCKKPFQYVTFATRRQRAEDRRAFTRKCFIDAGVSIARKNGIWSVTKAVLEEEAGGCFYNYFISMEEYLRLIEFKVYTGYVDENS